jgi:hypothetical protein
VIGLRHLIVITIVRERKEHLLEKGPTVNLLADSKIYCLLQWILNENQRPVID